jgi:putative membrane protein
MEMWWYGNGMNAWSYTLMTVSMVLFWGLIIYGLTAWGRYPARGDRSGGARPTAEQLLAERFARGEIDEHEYYQRLDTLHGGPRPLVKP